MSIRETCAAYTELYNNDIIKRREDMPQEICESEIKIGLQHFSVGLVQYSLHQEAYTGEWVAFRLRRVTAVVP